MSLAIVRLDIQKDGTIEAADDDRIVTVIQVDRESTGIATWKHVAVTLVRRGE